MSRRLHAIIRSMLQEATKPQEHKSKGTSQNQVAAGLTYATERGLIKPGQTGVDFGGGKYDKGVAHVAAHGAKLHVYDPFNRTPEHNQEVERKMTGKAKYVGCHNVVNVIKEREHRVEALQKMKSFMGDSAVGHVTVHQGDKDGKSRITKSEKDGSTCWQNHQKTDWYENEVRGVFGDTHDIKRYEGGYVMTPKKSQ